MEDRYLQMIIDSCYLFFKHISGREVASSGRKASPLATVPFTTRILSNTTGRENMNCVSGFPSTHNEVGGVRLSKS